jgi:hypothetical protein
MREPARWGYAATGSASEKGSKNIAKDCKTLQSRAGGGISLKNLAKPCIRLHQHCRWLAASGGDIFLHLFTALWRLP